MLVRVLVLNLVLVACGASPTPTVAPTTAPVAQVPTATNTVTATATRQPNPVASPTRTPVRATATPARTPDAASVLERLKASGLPIGEAVVYTAESDPNKLLGRPNQYISKANFRDTRLPASPNADTSAGGSVEVFARPEEAQARKTYIENIGRSAPALVEYGYVSGSVLLRVSKALTPEQADQYRAALEAATR